jgi:hypothetical protein
LEHGHLSRKEDGSGLVRFVVLSYRNIVGIEARVFLTGVPGKGEEDARRSILLSPVVQGVV